MKNLVKLFNVSLLVGILFFQSNVFAQELQLNKKDTYLDSLVPSYDHLAIDNECIGTSGRYWDQFENYNAYRVYVNNTGSEELKVTISYGNNKSHNKSHNKSYVFYVKANSGHTVTVNNAVSGSHEMDFITSSGLVSGTVSVRISDSDL